MDSIIGINSSWFWAMMQFFVYLATLIAIIRQIKIQNRQIKIQNRQLRDQININIVTILNSLHEQWWSTRMRRARKRVCENHLLEQKSINVEEETVLSFFENISLYCEKRMIRPDYIWETYSYYIEKYYHILISNVATFQSKDPTYYSGFLKLKEQMDMISLQKGASIILSENDKIIFIESEKMCYSSKPVQP